MEFGAEGETWLYRFLCAHITQRRCSFQIFQGKTTCVKGIDVRIRIFATETIKSNTNCWQKMFLTKEVLFSPLCWLFGSFVCLDKELLTDVTLTKLGGRMGDGPKRKPKIFDWIGINEQIQGFRFRWKVWLWFCVSFFGLPKCQESKNMLLKTCNLSWLLAWLLCLYGFSALYCRILYGMALHDTISYYSASVLIVL